MKKVDNVEMMDSSSEDDEDTPEPVIQAGEVLDLGLFNVDDVEESSSD